MEWKSYFTDGLVQIAILLSLFRTDWNNYLNHSSLYNGYPEINEIIMGPLSVHTQSYIHTSEWHSSAIGLSHPKALSYDYASSIFQDIHALGRYQRFDTNIDAYLVNSQVSPREAAENAPSQATPASQEMHGPSDPNNNHNATSGINNSDTAEGANIPSPLVEGAHHPDNDFLIGDTLSAVFPGVELTKEDMELIEILWRQDVDLGAEREAYDLKQKQQKQKELELNHTLEKEKELAHKLSEDQKNQQNSTQNITYVVDRETGELIPAPADAHTSSLSQATEPQSFSSTTSELELQLQQQLQFQQQQQQLLQQQQQPQQQQPQLHELESVSNLTLEQTVRMLVENVDDFHFSPENSTNDPDIQQGLRELEAMIDGSMEPLQTQTSIEHRWQDITNLLPLDDLGQDAMNTSEGLLEDFNNTSLLQSTASLLQNTTSLLQNTSFAPQITPANLSFSEGLQGAGFQPPLLTPTDNISQPHLLPTEALGLNSSGVLASSGRAQGGFVNSSDSLMHRLLHDDGGDLDLTVTDEAVPMETNDTASDSAFSSGGATSSLGSPTRDLSDFQSNISSPYGVLEGATGGGSESDTTTYTPKYNYDADQAGPPGYEDGAGAYSSGAGRSLYTNHSDSSNSSEYSRQELPANPTKVSHNHTYPLQPGQEPRVLKSAVKASVKEELDPHDLQYTRDEKRAKSLNIPFSMEQMITSPVDQFNEMLEQHKLSDKQLQLIRDIRRRGKNKVAAQNCRKRKLEVIQTLEDEVNKMREERDRMERERVGLDKEMGVMKHKYASLYDEVFRGLRDESGHPYDPSEYTLQQTDDGELFLVPHNATSCIKDDPKTKTNRKRKDRKP